jgi:crotonobetaine/carnitine-CoA ligase
MSPGRNTVLGIAAGPARGPALAGGPTPSFAEVLMSRYADAKDRPFIAFEGGPFATYGQVIERAASLANALVGAGLAPGDRVLIALDNRPAFIDAWFACALGGFVMVPLNTLLSGRILEDVVRRAACRATIAEDPYASALDSLTAGQRLRIIDGTERNGWVVHGDIVRTGARPQAAAVRGGDPLSIMFTSGTTGPAKGAILSQAHCIARSGSYVQGLRIGEDDVMFTCLPLFHNNAQMASVLVAVLARARAAVYGKFSVSRFWEHIRASGATRFTLIGRMANLLLAAPVSPDERAHAVRSACIVPHPNGEDAFERRFGVRVVSQYYGCTEMIPLAPRIDQERRIGSCGQPSPGYECMVVDAEGQPVPDGEMGELVARPERPEGVMTGYLDMPAETLQAFRGLWYHTGDAARRDADGFFYLVGRLKDFIRRKGENISATEVEAALTGHPAVFECAAVGEPDEWGEEEVVLWVEARPGMKIDTVELLKLCAERLPAFMVPARIRLIDALPRNALGRIEKFKLKAPAPAK